eukprot:1771828-Pyramimonas_sp.AAC.1
MGFMGSGRVVFKMWLSPLRRAHSSYTIARVSLVEGGLFSKMWLSPECRAHSPYNFARASHIEGGPMFNEFPQAL